MMRRALIPHGTCGDAQPKRGLIGRLLSARALACASVLLVLATVLAEPSRAQSPSFFSTNINGKTFKKGASDMFGPTPTINKSAPLYMQADQLIYDSKTSKVVAQGNVEIYYNNYVLTADQVVYDQSSNKLLAEGNAQLKDPNGSITRADRFEALDDFRDAFVQSLSIVTRDDTRIAADRATRREGNLTEYERAKFTPCKSEGDSPPLWCLSAGRIVHDQKSATITYQDAQFEFFGVPVLYTPYFEHPDPTVKRRSGFLVPSFGNSSTLGFGTEIPYYFALAPNYDFTFHPRYWSKRGVLWQGDWRHRLGNGEYVINVAAIDQLNDASDGKAGWRGSVHTAGQFSLSSWWRMGWDVTLESDNLFRRVYQLDPILQTDRVNVAYLEGMSERNYFSGKLFQFGGLTFDNGSTTASRVMPVIDYNYIAGQPVFGGELSFNAHTRSMTRSTGVDSNVLAIDGRWRSQMIDPIGQSWTPFASVKGSVTNYSNYTASTTPDDTVFNGVAAAGATYAYPFVAHTGAISHTISPTAQIIARQGHVDQKRMPDEDARSLVFDDSLLFDTDKFSGYDRFETGTRANLGMQYMFQAQNGIHGKAVFGQSIHLAGTNPFANPGLDTANIPNFSPYSGLGSTRSDYVAGAYLSPWQGLNLITQARFDERDWTLMRQDSLAQAYYGPISGVVGYTFSHFDPYTGAVIDQREINGAATLKLTNTWSVSALMRYDIDAGKILQDQLQLKYSDECYVLSLNYIENFLGNPSLPNSLQPDRTLMLRFELKYLGDFNYGTNILANQRTTIQ